MENDQKDKGKWGGVFLVVLIAAAMVLAGLAIYYHNTPHIEKPQIG